MEDRNTTERSTCPFGLVLIEFGVHRLEEWTHERELEVRANNGSLLPDVACYFASVKVPCRDIWVGSPTLIICHHEGEKGQGDCPSRETREGRKEALDL